MSRSPLRRPLAIALLCGLGAAGLGYAVFSGDPDVEPDRTANAPRGPVSAATQQLLFRTTALGPSYGHLGLASVTGAGGPAHDVALTCDRVHVGGGHGICLSADRGVVTTYSASLFDEGFTVRHTLALRGVPNRARVSPDGRRGAVSVFVKGESYEGAGALTRTSIIDMGAGQTIAELEAFTVTRDNMPFRSNDLGFRGVTFARDGNRFYATLRAGGAIHLVEGDVDARRARIIADDVECPSLSPDERRIAFLRRLPNDRSVSRLHVLTLATGDVRPLAETRSVDDQVEWLDDGRILYALPHGSGSSAIWAVAADGTGEPVMMRADAYSPTVVR